MNRLPPTDGVGRVMGSSQTSGAASKVGGSTSAVLAMPPLVYNAGVCRIGIVDHLSIIRALILRVLRVKYRGNPFALAIEFFRISMVIIAHYLLFSETNKPMPAHVPVEVFVIAAFPVFYAFLGAAKTADSAGKSGAATTLIPGVTRMHVRLANLAWAFLSMIFFVFAVAAVLNLWGGRVAYPEVASTTLIFSLAVGLGFGYGLVVEALGRAWPIVHSIAHVGQWALFISSGIYFSVALLPPVEGAVFWYNPLVHLTEYERHSFDPGYPIAMVTLLYPAACAAVLVFAGLVLDRNLRRLYRK